MGSYMEGGKREKERERERKRARKHLFSETEILLLEKHTSGIHSQQQQATDQLSTWTLPSHCAGD